MSEVNASSPSGNTEQTPPVDPKKDDRISHLSDLDKTDAGRKLNTMIAEGIVLKMGESMKKSVERMKKDLNQS
jgi:hypothetical protein